MKPHTVKKAAAGEEGPSEATYGVITVAKELAAPVQEENGDPGDGVSRV